MTFFQNYLTKSQTLWHGLSQWIHPPSIDIGLWRAQKPFMFIRPSKVTFGQIWYLWQSESNTASSDENKGISRKTSVRRSCWWWQLSSKEKFLSNGASFSHLRKQFREPRALCCSSARWKRINLLKGYHKPDLEHYWAILKSFTDSVPAGRMHEALIQK